MSPGSVLVNVGTWSDKEGLVMRQRHPFVPPSRRRPPMSGQRPGANGDGGKTYILTTILEEPFLSLSQSMYDGVSTDGNDMYEGYVKDLALLIAEEIGVTFEIRPTRDGKYGSIDGSQRGGWNGMIGDLLRNEAEVAIGPLTASAAREQVVDFSLPFMPAEIAILVQEANTRFDRAGLFSFMQPLSNEIWICIFCAYVGVSIVIFIVSRFSPNEWVVSENPYIEHKLQNRFSISNSFWFALSSAMQQSNDLAPKSPAGRIVSGSWWFFTVIIVAAYTANFAAFMTAERMVAPISSADQLAQQTDIEYGTVLGGATMDFFSKTKINTYNKMWDFMVARREYVFVNTTSEGISRVRASGGRYAFLVESPIAEYANTRLPCNTVTATTRAGVNRNLNSGGGYGVATSKGSDIKELINKAVLKLRESGQLARLKAKWWYQTTQCKLQLDALPIAPKSELELSNLSGLFFILIVGLISGMVLALLEFCHKSKLESKQGKTTFSDSIKSKARQAIQGDGRDSDGSIRFYGGDSSAL